MRTEDIKKLDQAGFMVFRAQDYPDPIIMYYKIDHWVKFKDFGNFETTKERDLALEKLHQKYAVILD